MALATLSAKVDSENKKQFEHFCEVTGMNVSVCINMFVKEVLRSQKLPFVVTADPFYNTEHMEKLEKRVECGSHYGDH